MRPGAYPSVNGEPGCGNKELLTDIARTAWNFSGYFNSDCEAFITLESAHKTTRNASETLQKALDAGADYNCGCVVNNATHGLLAKGTVTEARITESARRIFRTLFQLGEFDPVVPHRAYGFESIDSPQTRALSLEAAEQGIGPGLQNLFWGGNS